MADFDLKLVKLYTDITEKINITQKSIDDLKTKFEEMSTVVNKLFVIFNISKEPPETSTSHYVVHDKEDMQSTSEKSEEIFSPTEENQLKVDSHDSLELIGESSNLTTHIDSVIPYSDILVLSTVENNQITDRLDTRMIFHIFPNNAKWVESVDRNSFALFNMFAYICERRFLEDITIENYFGRIRGRIFSNTERIMLTEVENKFSTYLDIGTCMKKTFVRCPTTRSIRWAVAHLAPENTQYVTSTAFLLSVCSDITKPGFIEHSKKLDEEDMKTQLDGKNCVVTGPNAGIGYAAAEALAFRGGNVYMVCRNKERGEIVVSKVQSVTGNQNVYLELCDLSSISHIKSWASNFISREHPVHILVNNAGLLEKYQITTPEGLELNLAVNVAGTFTITELMMPLLEKVALDDRVITVSSDGMYTAPLTEDLQFGERNFDEDVQYARTVRVLMALTERWEEVYSRKGIEFYSMHPGWATSPGVLKGLPELCESMSGMQSNEAQPYFAVLQTREFGHLLKNILNQGGVSSKGLIVDLGAGAALVFVTLRTNGKREFTFYRNGCADMLLTESKQLEVATAYKMEGESNARRMLVPFEQMFTERKVAVEVVVIEADNAAEAISAEIAKRSNTELVIGNSSSVMFSRKNKNLASRISERAPSCCTVYVISKGKLATVRPLGSNMIIKHNNSDFKSNSSGSYKDENSDTVSTSDNIGTILYERTDTSSSSVSDRNFSLQTDQESSMDSYSPIKYPTIDVQRFQALSTINQTHLNTKPSLHHPRDSILFHSDGKNLTPIVSLPLIDDSNTGYGREILEYRDELKAFGVVIEFSTLKRMEAEYYFQLATNMWLCKLIPSSDNIHELRSLNKMESWELFINKIFLPGGGEGCSNNQEYRCPLVRIASSYYELPYFLKPCFLYMGIFPEDHEIKVYTLVSYWIAEAFIQTRGPRQWLTSAGLHNGTCGDLVNDASRLELENQRERIVSGNTFFSPHVVTLLVATLFDNTLEARRYVGDRRLRWWIPFYNINGSKDLLPRITRGRVFLKKGGLMQDIKS